MLGASIGSLSFESSVLNEKVNSIKKTVAKIPLLQDANLELFLLKSCYSLPKLSYLLRSVDATKHPDILENFDFGIRHTLEEILGSSLTDDQWLQASLLLLLGALGYG